MSSDHWLNSTPIGAIGSNDEGVTELRRCGECRQCFGRPRGSALTHQQTDETVSCAPDAEVEPLERVGRWTRR
ncbi:hypothetical protein ACIRG5_42255 [Lentzea sp. NPDC102401]|uniref:hypothetical protein n=1 Tax=Lentzea sp. NPDC102401 TaxID=3364128 RepID=UPI00381C6D09